MMKGQGPPRDPPETPDRSSNSRCAASTRVVRWRGKTVPLIVTKRMWRPTSNGNLRRPEVVHRKLAAGPAYRFTSVTASGCPKGVAEIAIQFKAPPAVLFAAESPAPLQPNALVLRIQPTKASPSA